MALTQKDRTSLAARCPAPVNQVIRDWFRWPKPTPHQPVPAPVDGNLGLPCGHRQFRRVHQGASGSGGAAVPVRRRLCIGHSRRDAPRPPGKLQRRRSGRSGSFLCPKIDWRCRMLARRNACTGVMTVNAPTRPTAEIVRLGREIYERDIRGQVEEAHHGGRHH